jgi:hypothetical protein
LGCNAQRLFSLFADAIKIRPLSWVNHWRDLVAEQAIAHAQTQPFEPLKEEFNRMSKFEPELVNG